MAGRTAQDVQHAVQQVLHQQGRKGKLARVLDAQKQYDNVNKAHWWMVRVEIDVPIDNLHRYYELFSDVEESLESSQKLNVLLVPTAPAAQVA